MLWLAVEYWPGCLKLLVLQGLLLGTALVAVALTGLGIDAIRYTSEGRVDRIEWPTGLGWLRTLTPREQVAWIAGMILAVALLRAVLNYRYAVESAIVVQRKIVVDLRARVYDRLQRLQFGFFDAQATGSIINRVTGDVQAVRSFVDGVLVQGIVLILSLVCYLVYMLDIHVGLTLATLATTPLLWWATAAFSRSVRPEYDRQRELFDRLVLVLSENVQGVTVVKGFHREPDEIEKFRRASQEVHDQQRSIFRKVSLFTPLIGFLTQVNLAILLGYGGILVMRDELALGTGLVVFAGLLQQFSSQVTNTTNIANSVQQALSGARRVFEVLDTPLAITSPPNAVRLPECRGEIEFDRVTFGFRSDQPVLRDVSFRTRPGEIVGLLAPTGAGKTTLLSLIPRFHDPDSGEIRVDGHPLRACDLDDLRRHVGIVFQETFLFSHTVSANIAFGAPTATRERIEAAAKIARAHEFIVNLPEGYDTVLGEAGVDLSGGQRQRLALARAVLLDPAILLLDDPTAAVDPHTEGEILAALRDATRGRTTFIAAHRLSALRGADRIFVLERGEIVQSGTHAELISRPGHYRDAATSQGVG